MRQRKPCALPASLLMLLFLSACGSQAPRAIDGTVPGSDPSSPTSTVRKPSATQKRGGGYYKDDGPGDDIPDNLDDIPDAQPRSEPLHRFANKPYNVLGRSYVPETSLRPFRQTGTASWYGKKFHGQMTSIGEPYDMFSMTAAHPTLAIPSYVRITNLGNGKSVIVRVTDRGPFHADRIIDLSYLAAYRLGYINEGSTQVEVEAVLPRDSTLLNYAQIKPPAQPAKAPMARVERDEIEILATRGEVNTNSAAASSPGSTLSPTSAPTTPKGVFLQLGAFSNADNADNLRSHLSRELDWLNEGIQISASGGIHRVQLGPYATRADAEKVAEKIRLVLGYKPGFVVR
ncbi:septal ring lytic transglycosylase RlpA family protein [Propionivibrio sp.]|uniref:septal ring lytic transglycosylase RlpA family protein n=1 Tax=Propionivibrio sp. TaxID=2212460 RepID=UPI0025DCC1F3|nr:septal ring lytic transglycosylase RlpA family protein [Propionivibrio sp.]MBK7357080.1 septal ring lytic transglycosylase RlpA family protein [Propionivibrio sp.]MBK8401490.1 septal ring lytic transglycosylase RlpA family protein [Propionivibrio sp.]MBK8745111.1 septal ring lytic transglycosylase RlpA family protein [Propionivibrio sp.]MBK8894100.1 septal ring lytic transglycosylase RlpA family protein [Propionivibrio sp.]MBL0208913.1 septal ring lytic transglycosylase RlpA family protein 